MRELENSLIGSFIACHFSIVLLCTTAILFFSIFFKFKEDINRKKMCTIVFIVVTFFSIILYKVYHLADSKKLPITISLFILMIMLFLLLSILFQGKNLRKFLFVVLFTFIENSAENINVVMRGIKEVNFTVERFYWAAVINQFVLVFIFFLRLFIKRDHYQEKKNSIIQTSIMFICTLLSITTAISSSIRYDNILSLNNFIVVLIFNFLLTAQLVSFKYSDTVVDKNYQYYREIKTHKILKDYYQRLEEHQDEIRRVKHDIKNQIIAIKGYAKSNNTNEMDEQFEKLLTQVSSEERDQFTRHPGLNAILNTKYRLAISLGIECVFKIKVPEAIKISDLDLFSIVGNILDNAIEACQYCETEKYINFDMAYHKNSIVIITSNSTDGNVDSFTTRKSNPLLHGIGLKTIHFIVDKYDGTLSYKFLETIFRMELTLFEKFD